MGRLRAALGIAMAAASVAVVVACSSSGTSTEESPIDAPKRAFATDGGSDDPADAGARADANNDGSPPTDATANDGGPFTDDFGRADDPAIGNNWLEKRADRFGLVNNAVEQLSVGNYRDNLVWRPAAETTLDVEVTATARIATLVGDPGVYARLAPGTASPGMFVGYTLYSDGPNNAFVDREEGSAPVELASVAISPALQVGQTYRYTLKVTGTNPVKLEGTIMRSDGTTIATITVNDSSAKRIVSAGSVGFGSGGSLGARFDDFQRRTF